MFIRVIVPHSTTYPLLGPEKQGSTGGGFNVDVGLVPEAIEVAVVPTAGVFILVFAGLGAAMTAESAP